MSIHEKEQLSEDILYLEYLIQCEKQNIKERIIKRLNQSSPIEQQLDVISDELSYVLGQMSARISVVEKSLTYSSLQPEKGSSETTNSNNRAPCEMQDEVKLSIVDLGMQHGLGTLQSSATEVPFHYIPPGFNFSFDLFIDRNQSKTIAIDVVECSTNKLFKNIQFVVDGHQFKHKVINFNGRSRLICYLPRSKTGNKTHVSIITPKVEVNELSSFKFGISDVHCVNKLGLFTAVLKKLRFN